MWQVCEAKGLKLQLRIGLHGRDSVALLYFCRAHDAVGMGAILFSREAVECSHHLLCRRH